MPDNDGGSGVAPEPIQVALATWELGADLPTIARVADAWRAVGDAATAREESLAEGVRQISEWTGQTRDSFLAYRGRLADDLAEVARQAADAARAVDGIADLVTLYQTALDDARSEIMSKVPSAGLPPEGWPRASVVFLPADEGQAGAVSDAIKEANGLRDEFVDALAGYRWEFPTSPWRAVADRWEDVAAGDRAPFRTPADTTGTVWLWIDGRLVVNTGFGDDDVQVSVDPDTGAVLVEINGEVHRVPAGTPLTIRTGEGDDAVEVESGVDLDLVLLGSRGNDRIRSGEGDDVILGLGGKDDLFSTGGDNYVSGGGEVDYVELTGDGDDRVFGGDGDDAVYALGGDNDVASGVGRDFVVTGDGDDTANTGDGDDVAFLGDGDNRVRGGAGSDVFYSGHGRDRIDGGSGDGDTAYGQHGDLVTNATKEPVEISDAGDAIRDGIDGSPEFEARVEADIALFEASPTGQQMLERLAELREVEGSPFDHRGPFEPPAPGGDDQHRLTIEELENDTEDFRPNEGGEGSGENGHAYRGDARPSSPGSSRIEYNPSFTFDSHQGNPATVLYHEMAHVYSFWNGNFDDSEFGVPQPDTARGEYQAVGLPYNRASTILQEPDVGIDPEQPEPFTENGWRAETGRPERQSY